MRNSFLKLFVFALVLVINSAYSQDFAPPGGPGGFGGGGGERGPRGPRELKFNFENDKDLFASEAEMNTYNEKLAELKTSSPEEYNQIQKDLMEKMRPQGGQPGQRPDMEAMKAKRVEMQKALKEKMADKVVVVNKEEAKPEVKPEVKADSTPASVVAPVVPEVKTPDVVVKADADQEKIVIPLIDEKDKDKDEDALVDDESDTKANKPDVAVKEEKEKAKAKPAPAPAKKEEHASLNYKPETCVWAEDIPRKIVVGANCSIEGARICIGYVVCEQKDGGGKFTRMSTCSEGLCGDEDASACTRQRGFGSFKPKPKTAESVSQKIDDVLKNAGKAQ